MNPRVALFLISVFLVVSVPNPLLAGVPVTDEVKIQGPKASYINVCAFSPSGRMLVVGSSWEVQIWSIGEKKQIKKFRSENPMRVVFSPNDKDLLIAKGKTILIHDIVKNKTKEINLDQYIGPMVVEKENNLLAIGIEDRLEVWDLNNLKKQVLWNEKDKRINALNWNSNGEKLVFSSEDGIVFVLNVKNKQVTKTYDVLPDRDFQIRNLSFSSSDELIFVTCYERYFLAVDTNSGKVKHLRGRDFFQGSWISSGYIPSKRQILLTSFESVFFVDETTFRIKSVRKLPARIASLAVSNDQRTIAVGLGNISGGTNDRDNQGILYLLPIK